MSGKKKWGHLTAQQLVQLLGADVGMLLGTVVGEAVGTLIGEAVGDAELSSALAANT
jgi:tetrahydromethanopterin S-methyltransferase subunit G